MQKSEPTITAEIDLLIEDIEASGVRWYVLGGTVTPGPCLAFEMPERGTLHFVAFEAMTLFDQKFRRDADIRQATIEWAMSIGAAYHETGNRAPVWGIGDTRQ